MKKTKYCKSGCKTKAMAKGGKAKGAMSNVRGCGAARPQQFMKNG